MGLDIYAGTLTRYFTGNWKTVTQEWAEENGFAYHKIRPDGSELEEEEIPADKIQDAMRRWSAMAADALSSHVRTYGPWEEDNEKDYYTDKPDWCAFGALLLYAACAKYGLSFPKKVPKDWDWQKDPIVARALEDEGLRWSLFSGTEWWLPFDGSFIVRCQMPGGCEAVMGTSYGLLAELREINGLGWNVREQTILGWAKKEGYPVDYEAAGGVFTQILQCDEYNAVSLAKFSFSILYQAAVFSEKHRVPILLDY